MSSAEYYLEDHINQFYRVLFFFMELQRNNISASQQDAHEGGALPDHVLPEGLQDILCNDTFYQNYLLEQRRSKVTLGDPENVSVQNLANRTSRVREEDLMWLDMMDNPSSGDVFSYTTSTTTTTPHTTTTTAKYHSSKKARYCEKDEIEHFCKNKRTFIQEITLKAEKKRKTRNHC